MGDFYTGYCDSGEIRVCDAVAASSAFPIGFGGLRLKVPDGCSFTRIDPWGIERPASEKRKDEYSPKADERQILTDGGVYDNLGVEPVWGKYSLLVSDAGSPFYSVKKNSQFVIPRLRRALEISMAQVGALRKRWLVDQFVSGRQSGALWSINTILEDYRLPDSQGYPSAIRRLLQGIRTDLNRFSDGEIAALENHGYSLTDAAIRSRARNLYPNAAAPFHWPFSAWREESKVSEALACSDQRRLLLGIGKYIVGKS